MGERDENVPRGDHVPDEKREENDAKRDELGADSASRRGHGTHGKEVGSVIDGQSPKK